MIREWNPGPAVRIGGLHQGAGSMRLLEPHGNFAQVICLACGATHLTFLSLHLR